MKMLKKLAIASAVAAVTSTTFALEQLDDATLAQTTGQDGIKITITPDKLKISQLLIHDNDGLDKTATKPGSTEVLGGTGDGTEGVGAGAVVVKDLDISTETGKNITVDVDTDGGTTAKGGAFVNAAVKMNGKTTISLGGVEVGTSGAVKSAYTGKATRGTTGTNNKILGGLSLALSDASMNVQLGAQPQGAMVLMNAELTNGLTIENLEVIDKDGKGTGGAPGGLLIKKAVLTDNEDTKLTLSQDIDIDGTEGIVIKMNAPGKGFYGYLTDVGISDGTGTGTLKSTIGDVEIIGLDTGNTTIAIAGR